MTITEQTPVADIAAALPSSVRVFQRHGVDFCCGGKRPLGQVCTEQGLSFAELAGAIEAAAAEPAPERDWTGAPLDALIDHIIATYHDPLREELPRLQAMATKVQRVHGAHAAYLARVEQIVTELAADLLAHMHKEELVLFPAIRGIANHPGPESLWLAAPISVMEREHDVAGALLAELREITTNYDAPAWACQTFRALFNGLDELERAMHLHVHLENNVLFPRALDTARRAAAVTA